MNSGCLMFGVLGVLSVLGVLGVLVSWWFRVASRPSLNRPTKSVLVSLVSWCLGGYVQVRKPSPRSPNKFVLAPLVFLVPWCFCDGQEPSKLPPFELKDGDRVVFLGDDFLDRERNYGYIETMLTRRYPGKHITFRNLSWEGDSVNIQTRPLNFPSLDDLMKWTDPTVIFISYGMNDSFEGEVGLPAFEKGYNAQLDRIAKAG